MNLLVVAATRAEIAHLPEGVASVVTGLGKVEAAAGTARAIAESSPDLVVNMGTAGSLRPGQSGVFVPSTILNHDLDSAAIRGFGYDAVDAIEVPGGDGTVLATGDRFIADPAARDELAERAHLVDMEGFAIARTCQVLGVPFRAVKVVSDSADEAAVDWPSVLDRCARDLADWLASHH